MYTNYVFLTMKYIVPDGAAIKMERTEIKVVSRAKNPTSLTANGAHAIKTNITSGRDQSDAFLPHTKIQKHCRGNKKRRGWRTPKNYVDNFLSCTLSMRCLLLASCQSYSSYGEIAGLNIYFN